MGRCCGGFNAPINLIKARVIEEKRMKKIFVVSTIMAFIVASLSAFSVFAAPNTSSRSWGPQLNELQADKNFYDHFIANHKNFVHPTDPIKIHVFLAEYAADLSKAEAIVSNSANAAPVNTKNLTSAEVNHQNQLHQTAAQDLAVLLHDMRALQARLVKIG